MPGRTFKSRDALAKLDVLIDHVCEHDGLTVAELAADLGWQRAMVEKYIVHAANVLKMVHKLPRPKQNGLRVGLLPFKWVGGPELMPPQPTPPKRKPAAPMAPVFRDPLTAALFGPRK